MPNPKRFVAVRTYRALKEWTEMMRLRRWLCLALALALAAPVGADVVILTTGARLEGRVTPAPGDPDAILFEDNRAQIKIARDRIREIQEEPDAVDYRKLGDQFFSAKRYEEARRAYNQSLEASPKDAPEVKQRLEALKQAESRAAAEVQREQLKKVDGMLDEAAKAIEAGKYADAQKTLEEGVPEKELLARQKERLVDLRKKLYRGWALERMDKLDSGAAAMYFEKYLKLNPDDEEAYAHLIDIYSKDPDKTAQVIEAHWVQLQLHPDDHMTRRKLAEKYVERARLLRKNAEGRLGDDKIMELLNKAAEQFAILMKAGDFDLSEVEREYVSVLRTLRQTARQKGDLDQAIAYHNRIPENYRRNEEDVLSRMKYDRDFRKLQPDDVKGRVALIRRVEQEGQDAFARQEFRQLQSQFPQNPAVTAMYKDYARAELAKAERALNTTRYEEAMTLAMGVIGAYGNTFEDIKLAAQEIQNKARTNLEKERRQNSENALKYKAQADRYFSEGKYHMDALLNKDRRSNPQVLSDKQEAIRNFKLAIENYDKALKVTTGVDDATLSAIKTDRGTAKRYLDTLTSTKVAPLGGPSNRLRRY